MSEPDIVKEVETYFPANNPQKWGKILSTINYRRLQLQLLKEILLRLKAIEKLLENIEKNTEK